MRLASYLKNEKANLGMLVGEQILNLTELGSASERYALLAAARDVGVLFSESGRSVLEEIHRTVLDRGIPEEWSAHSEKKESCRWLPPVAAPEKIICIGLNYRDHAIEANMPIPKEPVFFSKYNNALAGSAGPVLLPKNSEQVDYEAEMAVIIGRNAHRVSEEEALGCVGGYSIMNDVSARDWQFRTGQWISGKSFNTFGPLGPHLVTPDEVPDPHNLDIRLQLNGQVMQDSNTRNLIFGIPALISYLSNIFTLKAGDVISTGTPPGVGFARKPPVFLKEGDIVQITIQSIGTMQHPCRPE